MKFESRLCQILLHQIGVFGIDTLIWRKSLGIMHVESHITAEILIVENNLKQVIQIDTSLNVPG
jgi:hypothetical protein